MAKIPAEDVLEFGPRQLARLIREVFIAAGVVDDDLETRLDAALQSGSTEDLAAAAGLLWRRPDLLPECDRNPGLLSAVRRAAVGGVYAGITEQLALQVERRRDLANLVTIVDGRLWLSDLHFPPLMFAMEMNAFGCGPGWDEDRDVAELTGQPVGPAGTFMQWLRDVSGGDLVRRYVACPRWPGGFPAFGIPLNAERIRPIVMAARNVLAKYPCLVVEKPSLMGWFRELPSTTELVLGTRNPEERDGLCEAFNQVMTLYALREEPMAGMRSLLARTGERKPVVALVALIRTAIAYAICRGEAPGGGKVVTSLTLHQQPLAPLTAFLVGNRLVVNADGFAAVATWLGLVPLRYRPGRGNRSWDYASIRRCGWAEIERDGGCEVVDIAGERGKWLVLPAGGIPRGMTPAAITYTAAGSFPADAAVEMELRFPWDGADD